MSEGGSLINLGDLSKPATVLVDKVCNAVGVLYEPTRIRRKARADADAQKINALAQLELSGIEERALERVIHQEARKQENIERITAEAIAQLPADADPAKISEDWLSNLFRHCETVSDSEMRTLWAKVLSGEATKPGSFSKRTVNLVADLDKRDADYFTALGQFVWSFDVPTPMLLNLFSPSVVSAGLTLSVLKDLEALGLLSVEPVTGYTIGGLPRVVNATYYDTTMVLQFPGSTGTLDLGKVILTGSGKELFRLSGSKANPEYLAEVVTSWRAAGIVVNTPAYRTHEA